MYTSCITTTVSAAIYNYRTGHDDSTQLHYCVTVKCLHNSTRNPPRHLVISPTNYVMLQLSFITLKFQESASSRLLWRTVLDRLPAPGQCHQSWSGLWLMSSLCACYIGNTVIFWLIVEALTVGYLDIE